MIFKKEDWNKDNHVLTLVFIFYMGLLVLVLIAGIMNLIHYIRK